MDKALNVKEVAAILRAHPDTVRKMAKAGEIPAMRVGRGWIFHAQVLDAWLAERSRANVKRE